MDKKPREFYLLETQDFMGHPILEAHYSIIRIDIPKEKYIRVIESKAIEALTTERDELYYKLDSEQGMNEILTIENSKLREQLKMAKEVIKEAKPHLEKLRIIARETRMETTYCDVDDWFINHDEALSKLGEDV